MFLQGAVKPVLLCIAAIGQSLMGYDNPGWGYCVYYFVFLQGVTECQCSHSAAVMLPLSQSVSVLLISESAVTLWDLFINFIHPAFTKCTVSILFLKCLLDVLEYQLDLSESLRQLFDSSSIKLN